MTAVNATHGLWARIDQANPAGARTDGPDSPHCCWNLCNGVSPVKVPRPHPKRQAGDTVAHDVTEGSR